MLLLETISQINFDRAVSKSTLNHIQDGLFRSCSRMGGGGEGGQKAPLPKICHTFPKMMKIGTVTPNRKKIQQIFESSGAPFEFC